MFKFLKNIICGEPAFIRLHKRNLELIKMKYQKPKISYDSLLQQEMRMNLKNKRLISEAHSCKNMLKAEKARLYRLIDQKNITIENLEKALAKYENDDLKNGKYKLKKQDRPRRANGQFKAKGEK